MGFRFATPEAVRHATVIIYVKGTVGKRVLVDINGNRHEAKLTGSVWASVRIPIPISDLREGENIIAYTSNPDARLLTGGDTITNLGHSEFGGGENWSQLSWELICYLELK